MPLNELFKLRTETWNAIESNAKNDNLSEKDYRTVTTDMAYIQKVLEERAYESNANPEVSTNV